MNKESFRSMLELQAKMNAKVNPSWLTAGYPFLRAAVVEGGEAMEHHGWKWWKSQTMDKPQLQIELVDIWHFYLSHVMVTHGNIESAASVLDFNLNAEFHRTSLLFDGRVYHFNQMDTVARIELLIGLSVARRISIPLFQTILHDVDMSWDELRKQYVGKNVLNFFRQDHGYKEGVYLKHWPNGEGVMVEDNVILALIMQETTDPEEIYRKLKLRYDHVVLMARAA